METFENVTIVRKGETHTGVEVRPARDGGGDYYVQSQDGQARCFVTAETYQEMKKGEAVNIDLGE